MAEMDGETASSVEIQMERQSWSLEPAQIGVALFSKELGNDEKCRLAAKIVSLLPQNFSFSDFAVVHPSLPAPPPRIIQPAADSLDRGKPPLPKMNSSSSLEDFVTPRSVIFFARFCPNQRSAFEQASWRRYHGGIICIIRVEVSEFRSFYCNIRFWRFFYVSLEKRGVSINITFCQINLWTIFNEIDKNDITFS